MLGGRGCLGCVTLLEAAGGIAFLSLGIMLGEKAGTYDGLPKALIILGSVEVVIALLGFASARDSRTCLFCHMVFQVPLTLAILGVGIALLADPSWAEDEVRKRESNPKTAENAIDFIKKNSQTTGYICLLMVIVQVYGLCLAQRQRRRPASERRAKEEHDAVAYEPPRSFDTPKTDAARERMQAKYGHLMRDAQASV